MEFLICLKLGGWSCIGVMKAKGWLLLAAALAVGILLVRKKRKQKNEKDN